MIPSECYYWQKGAGFSKSGLLDGILDWIKLLADKTFVVTQEDFDHNNNRFVGKGGGKYRTGNKRRQASRTGNNREQASRNDFGWLHLKLSVEPGLDLIYLQLGCNLLVCNFLQKAKKLFAVWPAPIVAFFPVSTLFCFLKDTLTPHWIWIEWCLEK